MFERIWRASLAPLAATAAAIIISSIALLISGNSPIDAFKEMWQTIDSTESVVLIINRAVPYYIAGVAVAIGFKMNLFNIGSNGQYILAALIAGWAGAQVSLPPPIHVAFVFLVAVTVGGTWALFAAILNVTRNVNVVIATIMLNYIAIGIVAFLLNEFLADEATEGLVKNTKLMPTSARIPSLNKLVELTGFDFAPGVESVRFPAVRHPPRRRLLRPAQPEPVRLRAAPVGSEPRGRPFGRRQPEADGVDHAVHVRRDRRHDRAAVPARRPELPQVRRRVPDAPSASPGSVSRCSVGTIRSASPRPPSCGRRSNGRRSDWDRSASRRRSAGSCRERSCSPP